MEKVCFEAVAQSAKAAFYPGPWPALQAPPDPRKACPNRGQYLGPCLHGSRAKRAHAAVQRFVPIAIFLPFSAGSFSSGVLTLGHPGLGLSLPAAAYLFVTRRSVRKEDFVKAADLAQL